MQLPIEPTHQFDPLVSYAQEIHRLNEGSGCAVVVIQQDRIVTESYSGFHSQLAGARPIQADSQFNVASARKSYIGYAIAYAVHQGLINSLDDLVSDYLPEVDRTALADTTIRHLVTHTHGLGSDEQGNLIREFEVGRNWAYRGENVLMAAEIVRRVTGRTVAQVLQETVFEPLGWSETGWRTEPNERLVQVIESPAEPPEWRLGTPDGAGSNLFASAREFAYWGYLHLKKGRMGERQIVPEAVIELATTRQSPPLPDPDLPEQGLFWYVKSLPAKRSEIGAEVPNGSYQILGINGPLVLVIPAHDLVVVRMSNKRRNYGGAEYLRYLREFGDQVMKCL